MLKDRRAFMTCLAYPRPGPISAPTGLLEPTVTWLPSRVRLGVFFVTFHSRETDRLLFGTAGNVQGFVDGPKSPGLMMCVSFRQLPVLRPS